MKMGFALIEKHDILFLHCTDVRRAAMAGTERYVRNSTADFLVFTKDSETDGIEVRVQDHEVWLTQKGMDNCLMLTAVLFQTSAEYFCGK